MPHFNHFPSSQLPQFLICFSHHQYPPNLMNNSKVQNFSAPILGGIPGRDTPIFRHTPVCFKLYTTPWYHPSAFCGLKGDSDGRKTKKKKKKKDKNKEKFYSRRNKWTWPIQRYWLVFSKTTNFFQRISLLTEIYHFKIYHFLSIFRLRNFGHVTGSPHTWYANSLYLNPCCVQIATFYVEHFFLLKAK